MKLHLWVTMEHGRSFCKRCEVTVGASSQLAEALDVLAVLVETLGSDLAPDVEKALADWDMEHEGNCKGWQASDWEG